MKNKIEKLISQLRDEMRTRMEDDDVVVILSVLEEAEEELERMNQELAKVTEERDRWRTHSFAGGGNEDMTEEEYEIRKEQEMIAKAEKETFRSINGFSDEEDECIQREYGNVANGEGER